MHSQYRKKQQTTGNESGDDDNDFIGGDAAEDNDAGDTCRDSSDIMDLYNPCANVTHTGYLTIFIDSYPFTKNVLVFNLVYPRSSLDLFDSLWLLCSPLYVITENSESGCYVGEDLVDVEIHTSTDTRYMDQMIL